MQGLRDLRVLSVGVESDLGTGVGSGAGSSASTSSCSNNASGERLLDYLELELNVTRNRIYKRRIAVLKECSSIRCLLQYSAGMYRSELYMVLAAILRGVMKYLKDVIKRCRLTKRFGISRIFT